MVESKHVKSMPTNQSALSKKQNKKTGSLSLRFFCLFQTGCSPASAFASFSKRPASPPHKDGMSRNASGMMHSLPDTLASNIPTFPRSVSPASYSPPASPLEGDVVIPCEFCGVALEEAVVFHHQVCH